MKRPDTHDPTNIDTGVKVYQAEALDGIEYNETTDAIINSAIDAYNVNHRPIRDFFGPREVIRPKVELPELMLPEGVDPHGPVLQLAKSAVVNYGGEFFASVDTSKSKVSNRAADTAVERLEDLARARSFGFVFLVQRYEDRHNPRIERMRGEISRLAVPSMSVITLPAPEAPEAMPADTGAGDISDS
jgi:hypothetical protein